MSHAHNWQEVITRLAEAPLGLELTWQPDGGTRFDASCFLFMLAVFRQLNPALV